MHIRFLSLLLTGTTLAGPLRFSPDTVCAGYTTSCMTGTTVVKNVSKDTAIFDVRYMISPTDSKSELAILESRFGSIRWDPDYARDSSRKLSSGYLQTFKAGYRQEKLAPGDTSKLGRFMFGSCLLCTGMGSASALPSLGHGEMVSLVIGSAKTGFDTLHVKVNTWTTGAIADRPAQASIPKANGSYKANGRPTEGSSTGIVLGPDGSKPRLRESSRSRKAVIP
ncbi:MAG: hypothetical protein AAB214_14410 [Fibrobacterota bacterium]